MSDSTTRPPVTVTDGGRIRELRTRKLGIDQAELAARLGIKRQSLVNIECGHRSASLHLLQRIALELGEPLESLLRQPGRAAALPPDELGPPGQSAGQRDYR